MAAATSTIPNAHQHQHQKQQQDRVEISFVTDVEGNLDYWNRFVDRSRVIRWVPGSNKSEIEFRPQEDDGDGKATVAVKRYLVFGGDCFDKGVGDEIISRQLVRLKKQHPDRVFLIIGNRDLNKLRFTSELQESDLKHMDHHVFWFPEGPTVRSFLKDILTAKYSEPTTMSPNNEQGEFDQSEYDQVNTVVNRLKWMLSCTMGASTSFEQRRKAMAHKLHQDLETISDEQVAEDYLNSVVKPDGFVREYIENANIALCLGNTLFVHGAVTERNIGFLPTESNREAVQENPPGEETAGRLSVQEWVNALNNWGRASFEEWKREQRWNSDRTSRGGHAIMGYYYARAMSGVPPKGARTVAITDWLTHGHPVSPPPVVREYLNRSSIFRVVTGHKPFGDSPAIMRPSSSTSSLEVISADTSYSDSSAADMRGIAVSEVLIRGTLDSNQAQIHGVLKDGTEFDFVLPPPSSQDDKNNNTTLREPGDRWIGKETPCGWWVKAKLGKEELSYVLVKGSGHKVDYKTVSLSQLTTLFAENPTTHSAAL